MKHAPIYLALVLLAGVGCSPPENSASNQDTPGTDAELLEAIYCGDGDIPEDFSSPNALDKRCFWMDNQRELEFFVREFGDLGEYINLGIRHLDADDLSIMSDMDDFRVHRFHIGETELKSLAGLEKLQQVRTLEISSNPRLTRIDALTGLQQVDYEVNLFFNEALESADLPNLKRIGTDEFPDGRLVIDQNHGIQSIDGYNVLKQAGTISITDNQALAHIKGFQALEKLWGLGLGLGGHPMLTSIDGFDSLTSIDGCNILNNPSLSACNVETFCAKLNAESSLNTGNKSCSAM